MEPGEVARGAVNCAGEGGAVTKDCGSVGRMGLETWKGG